MTFWLCDFNVTIHDCQYSNNTFPLSQISRAERCLTCSKHFRQVNYWLMTSEHARVKIDISYSIESFFNLSRLVEHSSGFVTSRSIRAQAVDIYKSSESAHNYYKPLHEYFIPRHYHSVFQANFGKRNNSQKRFVKHDVHLTKLSISTFHLVLEALLYLDLQCCKISNVLCTLWTNIQCFNQYVPCFRLMVLHCYELKKMCEYFCLYKKKNPFISLEHWKVSFRPYPLVCMPYISCMMKLLAVLFWDWIIRTILYGLSRIEIQLFDASS